MNKQQVEIIETLKEYIHNLINGINGIIDKITSNKLSETFCVMPDIIEGLQWVNDAVKCTSLNEVIEYKEKEFDNLLKEILLSYENNDSILSKDLLKYEVIPFLDNIEIALNEY